MILAAIVLVAAGFLGGLFTGKAMDDEGRGMSFRGAMEQNGPALGDGHPGWSWDGPRWGPGSGSGPWLPPDAGSGT
jgi:hypothetical protein